MIHVMSGFAYHQYNSDSYVPSPTTPNNAYTWTAPEILANEQQQQHPHHQPQPTSQSQFQHQSMHQQQMQDHHSTPGSIEHSPLQPMQDPGNIQSYTPSVSPVDYNKAQLQIIHHTEPTALHQQAWEASRSSASPISVTPPGHAVGPLRTPVVHPSPHPYKRRNNTPASSNRVLSKTATTTDKGRSVRFASSPGGSTAASSPGSMSAPPLPRDVKPVLDTSPLASVVAPPPTLSKQAPESSRAAAAPQIYSIRTDFSYDSEKKTLEFCCELPGVKSTDVSVTLSTCVWNRVRQVVVSGISRPTFVVAESVQAMRERKCGLFRRVFVVPPQTKAEDVSVSMSEGLLCMRIACGEPAESEDRHEISVS